jgi:hypothetical protein
MVHQQYVYVKLQCYITSFLEYAPIKGGHNIHVKTAKNNYLIQNKPFMR